jgi:hypothetical protein
MAVVQCGDTELESYCDSWGHHRHCERSEAIQGGISALDCFVASLLAMTVNPTSSQDVF